MINGCRGCGNKGEFKVLFAPGKSFAVVKFKDSPEEKDDYYPLDLLECDNCHLVQLKDSVPPDRLYSEFHYLSGINQSMNDALFDIVKTVEKTVVLKPDDIVVDIGANDGTLLSYYRRFVYTIGFEPAKNIKPEFEPNEWHNHYFSAKQYFTTTTIPYSEIEKAKVVTAIAMFYDLDDPNVFLKDVHDILAEDGIFVIQMNDLDSMVQNISIDNICHEHLCYYNEDTLLPLLIKNKLYPLNISYNNVNGGSIRVICSKKECKDIDCIGPTKGSLEQMWASFEKEKKRLLRYLDKNGPIWAYGASTRGNTLLQLLGLDVARIGLDLDRRKIVAIADRNSKKWRKFTAGGNIPIVSEKEMREIQPDNLLILPYYFEKEFLSREIEYLKKGGKMIFPLPKMRIWTADKDGNLKVHGL